MIQKYKHEIKIGKKSIDQLIDYLHNNFNVIEVDRRECLTKISCTLLDSNIENCERFRTLGLSGDDLDYVSYVVKEDQRSSKYYYGITNTYKIGEKIDKVYVIFERMSEYIETNSAMLGTELFLKKGITKDDYDKKTIDFCSYLGTIDTAKKIGLI